MRGRVFSAFYVMRDVIFLVGMAGAGLADVVDIRYGRLLASACCSVGRLSRSSRPGLRVGDMACRRGATGGRRRGAGLAHVPGPARPPWPISIAWRPHRPARAALPRAAGRVLRSASVREVPSGTQIVQHGDIASSAYFILDGSAAAGIPDGDSYRGLSTMGAGDFFGEIAALTGSARTADVIADSDTILLEVPAEALRATMVVPEIQRLVHATLTTRLLRTETADLPRLAGVDQEPCATCGRRAPRWTCCSGPTTRARVSASRHQDGQPRARQDVGGRLRYGSSGITALRAEG